MPDISITDTEALKFALDNDILDISSLKAEMIMKSRQEYLQKHKYEIWLGTNGLWNTYLPDEKKGRVPKRRKTREQLEDLIVSYYQEQDENPTIYDLFIEWVGCKLANEEISNATYDRYKRQFEQCFVDFQHVKIKSVSEYDTEQFIISAIKKFDLTAKGFSNMRTIIIGLFKLAKRKKYITFSIKELLDEIEISRKMFRKNVYDDSDMVFMENEIPRVVQYLTDNIDILNLGILLMFKTGLRIGELSALRREDVSSTVIHVHSTEISYTDNVTNERVYTVRNFPKTEAGIRDVYIPTKYSWILDDIFRLSSGTWLFEQNGSRVRTYVFRQRLLTVCKKTGVIPKSPHKVRKTYGSILIDSGAAESLVIKQMGHTDIKTTKKYYYRNRKSSIQIGDAIDSVSEL